MTENKATFFAIYNPRSGGRSSLSERELVFSQLTQNGVNFHFDEADDTDTFGKTSRAVKAGYRNFIIIGGDGTLNQAVNALFKQNDVPYTEFLICVIPYGTGNDWIRTIGIPRDYKEAAKLPAKGKEFIQDIGKVIYEGENGRETAYFANIAGFAYDAFVTRKTNETAAKKHLGKLSYQLTLMKCLFSFEHVQAKITVDDTVIETPLFSGNVAKCKYNGNGMMQVPHAEPADGLLAVTLIKGITKLGIVFENKNIYNGSFIKNKHVQILKGKKVRVETQPAVELECEGELFGKSPFEFEVIPQALRVLVP